MRNDITARSNDCTRQNMGSTCDGRSQRWLDIRESIGFLIARSFVGNRRDPSRIPVGEEKANMLCCACGRRTQTGSGYTDRNPGGSAVEGLELGRACRCAGVRKHCDHRFGSGRTNHGDDRPQAWETNDQFHERAATIVGVWNGCMKKKSCQRGVSENG
jgi:hypothetical protein